MLVLFMFKAKVKTQKIKVLNWVLFYWHWFFLWARAVNRKGRKEAQRSAGKRLVCVPLRVLFFASLAFSSLKFNAVFIGYGCT
jgi:hypothetical protein